MKINMWQGIENILSFIREELKKNIIEAVKKAVEENILKPIDIPDFYMQKPDTEEYGDMSSPLPLMLSRQAKMPPKQIAEAIVQFIGKSEIIEKVEVAGPGFINIFLSDKCFQELLFEIKKRGKFYGQTNIGNGEKVQVEFVSANPVGPLNVVSARAASVGDCLANLLKAIGYNVERESYINDAGVQVDTFARSVDARFLQALGKDVQFPEDGYHGDYIKDLANDLINDYGNDLIEKPEPERIQFFKQEGLRRMIEGQRNALLEFGVKFDQWASEKAVRDSGLMDEALKYIKEHNYSYDHEGATWFKSTLFGDDRDRVLIKSNGDVTYMVPDIAYHLDKSNRGFKKVIDLWGPDHHGYIPRMKAAMQALGLRHDWLEILIVQQVNLIRAGQAVRMSKRAGQFVTLRQLIDELSEKVSRRFAVDVARFFFLMRSTSAHLDFDMDLAIQQADTNPVFYVQYAHARICSIFKRLEEMKINIDDEVDSSLLKEPEERQLMKKLADYPDVVYESAIEMSPHIITRYLQDLSALFHSYYNKCKVLDIENIEMTKARLLLIECIMLVLQNGLGILGISAPQSM